LKNKKVDFLRHSVGKSMGQIITDAHVISDIKE